LNDWALLAPNETIPIDRRSDANSRFPALRPFTDVAGRSDIQGNMLKNWHIYSFRPLFCDGYFLPCCGLNDVK